MRIDRWHEILLTKQYRYSATIIEELRSITAVDLEPPMKTEDPDGDVEWAYWIRLTHVGRLLCERDSWDPEDRNGDSLSPGMQQRIRWNAHELVRVIPAQFWISHGVHTVGTPCPERAFDDLLQHKQLRERDGAYHGILRPQGPPWSSR